MIKDAVEFISGELDQHLKNTFDSATSKITLTNMIENLHGTAGSTTTVGDGTIGITLINIEEERVTKVQGAQRLGPNGALGKANPEIKLNLYLLFSAFSDENEATYLDSLELLDEVVKFFQRKNVFTKENSPSLNTKFGRLMMDLYSLPLEQQNYIWGSLGAQYLPSVIYKARIILVQEEAPVGSSTPIVEIDTNLSGK